MGGCRAAGRARQPARRQAGSRAQRSGRTWARPGRACGGSPAPRARSCHCRPPQNSSAPAPPATSAAPARRAAADLAHLRQNPAQVSPEKPLQVILWSSYCFLTFFVGYCSCLLWGGCSGDDAFKSSRILVLGLAREFRVTANFSNVKTGTAWWHSPCRGGKMPSANRTPSSACASGSPRSAAVRTNSKATAGLKTTPSPAQPQKGLKTPGEPSTPGRLSAPVISYLIEAQRKPSSLIYRQMFG